MHTHFCFQYDIETEVRRLNTLSFRILNRCFIVISGPYLHTATADSRVKRQDDDDEEQTTDELCQDRPADEYFRLSSDGDCRDVVR